MQSGDVVAQRFELEGLARAGGMGSVFRARDRTSGEYVAVKIAHPEAMHHAERFAREATVLAELRHPGIVRYVDHGRTEAGDMYLAMEWLEGEDLAQRLGTSGLTLPESLTLINRIAETLSGPHQRGLVHRDLKPSNLFLPNGDIANAKVLDFGIVRVADHDGDRSTQTGMVLGTIGYMAPEQARGAPDVDARVDVFALGCVLFECITGRPAFTGRDALAVQAKILLEEAPRIEDLRSDVPPGLCDLVARMLRKDPTRRPANAAAIKQELVAIAAGNGARRARTSERPLGLTTGEQRLLCVVMLSSTRPAPLHNAAAPTLASDSHGGSVLAMREAARAHGGRLEALANGSVIVTLEGNSAATDQAAGAARCALALRAIVPTVSMALATGRGDASSRWPVGEVIDHAVQVLRVAEARAKKSQGTLPIDLDELTAGLLDARFEVRFERGGAQLLGVRDSPSPTRTLLGKPTPFVGRTRELGMLEAIFDECVAEGIGQAVLVEGPPGVGKTRLVWELCQRLAARGDDVQVWTARGDPMSAGSPFAMISQVIRNALGLSPGSSLDEQRGKMRARLSLIAEGKTLDRFVEFLGELIDVPASAEPSLQLRAARQEPILMGDQMRRAFEDWLSAERANKPILLALEDLHWGDLPSVQFIDGALRQSDNQPLMVLATARPEVHALFPMLWAERKVTRMSLGELTRKASERLVRHVLGDEMPDSTVNRLVDHAAGNAFYLEEVIRAASGDGARDLPPTIVAMVQARLEGLPPETRRVLRAASVFGQYFWCGGVKALVRDLTDGEVGALLEDLAQRELLVRRAGEALGEWGFRHALVREGAYAMLVDRDRALGHLLAAEWLEQEVATTHVSAAVLAEHFERGNSPERAARWYYVAAEEALEGNDFVAVVSRAERGIACGQKLENLGALRLLQAEGHRWRGQLAEAETHAFDALNSLSPDDVRWYGAAGELAVASALRGSNERLREVGQILVEVPLRPELVGAQIIAWSRAATWLVLLGFAKATIGDALCARIEEAAATLKGPDPAVTARVLYTRATRALVTGDISAYLRLSQAAADDFDTAGILRSLYVLRRNIGLGHLKLGDYEKAEGLFRELLEAVSRMHIGTLGAEVEHWLGVAVAAQGNLEEARLIEEHSVAIAVADGAKWIEGRARACLASMLLRLGLPEQAEVEARRAMDVSRNSPAVHALALGALAEIRFECGAPEETLSLTNDALELLSTVGGIEEGEALVRLLHAQALRATGDVEASRVAILEARDRLLERASRISDESMRCGMLERVQAHARTIALAEEWVRS